MMWERGITFILAELLPAIEPAHKKSAIDVDATTTKNNNRLR
jgi:hypothetical protein